MKNSTKTMIKGTVCYACDVALACVGSDYGGRWAGRAKTTIGKTVRLGAVLAACYGSSYLVSRGVEKLCEEYQDQVEEEEIMETLSVDM